MLMSIYMVIYGILLTLILGGAVLLGGRPNGKLQLGQQIMLGLVMLYLPIMIYGIIG